ncbi:MAG: hypothetical protein ABEI74_02415, partial [Candidatus Pacearchaeota archaeon]
TSFAQNWLSDRYVQDQIENKNIRSEKECISGSASAFNALNSNIQAGAENALDPQIYQSGLTRICAEENPGQRVPNDRWVDVGHCGDPEMRCWLDQRSIKESIDNEFIQNQTLNETEKTWRGQINTSDEYLTNRKDFWNKLDNILENESSIDALKVDKIREIFENGDLTRLLDRVVYNDMKAEVLFERGKGYAKLAKTMFEKWAKELRKDRGGESDRQDGGEDKLDLPEKKAMCESPKLRFKLPDNLGGEFCYKYFDGSWHWTNQCEKVGTTIEKESYSEELGTSLEKEVKIKWISVQNRSKLESVESQGGMSSESLRMVRELRFRNYQEGIGLFLNEITKKPDQRMLSTPGSFWESIEKWASTARSTLESIETISHYEPTFGQMINGGIELYEGLVDLTDSIGSFDRSDSARTIEYLDDPGYFKITYVFGGNELIYKVKHSSFSSGEFENSYESGWSWVLERVNSGSGSLQREDLEEMRNSVEPAYFEPLKNMGYERGGSLIITGRPLPKCFGYVYGKCDSPGKITCSSDRKTVLSCKDGKWGPKDTCSYGQYCNPNVEESYCQNYIGEQQDACFPVDSKVCSEDGDKILQCFSGAFEQAAENIGIAEATSTYTEIESCGQGKKCNPVSNECVDEQNLPSGWAEFYETGKNPYVSGSRSLPESRDSAESRSSDIRVSKNQMSVDELSKLLKDTGTTTKWSKGEELVGRTCDCTGSECEDLAKGIISATEQSQVPDPLLVLSIVMQESSCEIGENTAGAKGLMQLTKQTTLEICEPQMGVGNFSGYYGEAKTKAQNNLDCGTLILSYKKSSTDGNVVYSCKQGDQGYKSENRREEVRYTGWKAALRGYVGTGCGHPYYVEQVMKRYAELRKISGNPLDTQESSEVSETSIKANSIEDSLNDQQLDDISPLMEDFAVCLGKNYKSSTGEKLKITSITDNSIYSGQCDPSSNDFSGCTHKRGSCHYSTSGGDYKSKALDFSLVENKEAFDNSFRACQRKFVKNGRVSNSGRIQNIIESDHYHIEIQKNC